MADIPGDTTTTDTLRVGGSVSDAIDPSFDQDWFQVTLTAGVTYHIELDGAGASPLADPLVRLLDRNGSELARDDDSGDGLNSLLTFTPSSTDNYYISAEAFSSYTGEYTLSLTESDIAADTSTTATLVQDGFVRGILENIVIPDPFGGGGSSTRYDEDWFRIDLEAGENYTFAWGAAGADAAWGVDLSLYDPNGNLVYQVSNPGNWDWSYINWTPGITGTWYVGVNSADNSGEYTLSVSHVTGSPLDSIDAGTALRTQRIDVYFAQNGETFGGTTSEGWNSYEIGQAMAALGEYSGFANVTFSQTPTQADAEFALVLDDDELNAQGLLGQFGVPGFPREGIGAFNSNYRGWSTVPGGGTDKGGYGWEVLIHEFGHGLGLAHPHDDGFGSTVMNGVDPNAPDGDFGDFDLNQGIYTVMSYNDGWATAPQGVPQRPDGSLDVNYGWVASPMAFDIALIQQKYGANMGYHAGNDTYTLPVANQAGTFYSCIWDAGGSDTIRAGAAALSCTIDLRAATLRYEPGGGGWVSYHSGIYGGFTIANGAVIENAVGGSGNDRLIGNAAANRLNGGAGADTMNGKDGNDTYVVDNTGDKVIEANGAGIDLVKSSVSFSLVGQNIERLTLTGTSNLNGAGNAFANTLIGNAGDNILTGGKGADTLYGGAGIDTASYAEKTAAVGVTLAGAYQAIVTVGGVAEDSLFKLENVVGGSANDSLTGDSLANVLAGTDGNDLLRGQGGNDTLNGGAGLDRLAGGAGLDKLNGGGGNDAFIYTALADSGITSTTRDQIRGFAPGDRINVRPIDAIAGGADNAFALDTDASFSAGEIRQTVTPGGNLLVEFNVDAGSTPEMSIVLIDRTTLLTDADFVL